MSNAASRSNKMRADNCHCIQQYKGPSQVNNFVTGVGLRENRKNQTVGKCTWRQVCRQLFKEALQESSIEFGKARFNQGLIRI